MTKKVLATDFSHRFRNVHKITYSSCTLSLRERIGVRRLNAQVISCTLLNKKPVAVVAFLMPEDKEYVTRQVISVNGGLHR
jgi:hypothetical protein